MKYTVGITSVVLTLATVLSAAPAAVAQPLANMQTEQLAVPDLLKCIDKGANADHLKYRFLMGVSPRGSSRDEVIGQVRQALDGEKDPGRRLLLQSVLAFGLARSQNEQERQKGIEMYAALLKTEAWPKALQPHWEHTRADFLGAIKAVRESDKVGEMLAEMFAAYLRGETPDREGAMFGVLASGIGWPSKTVADTINKMSETHKKDINFWMRLGAFYLGDRSKGKEASECFSAAWQLGPKDDTQSKVIGHGLVASYERNSDLAKAIEAEKHLLDSLAVKDDYVGLANLYCEAGNMDAMRKALSDQLASVPGDRSKVKAAQVLLAANFFNEASDMLTDIPAPTDPKETHEGAALAACVLKVSLAKARKEPLPADALEAIRSRRQEFLRLANEQEWLRPYYQQGLTYLRASDRKSTPKTKERP